MTNSGIFSLHEKDIWVFGGAGYLGQPTVQALIGLGAKILCVDLENRAHTFVQSANLGANVTPAILDVRDGAAIKQFVADNIQSRGVPHGLVNLTFASTGRKLEE